MGALLIERPAHEAYAHLGMSAIPPFLVIVAIALSPLAASAATFHIPADYPTIQSAITAAAIGDTVLVAPDTYSGPGNKDLDFGGKTLVVRSEAGASSTIIDCQGSGRGFHFHSFETADARVEGFTITNGSIGGAAPGGAIHCDHASPTIADCVLAGNSAFYGGAISCYYFSQPTLIGCRLSGNSAREGGAVYCFYGRSPRFESCLVSGNLAQAEGGGLSSRYGSSPLLSRCTLSSNRAATGGGLFVYQATATVEHTILSGNCADQGAEGYLASGNTVHVTCCALDSSGIDGIGQVIYGGAQVFGDPMLCDPAPCAAAPTSGGDFALRTGSPCLPENSPCEERIGAFGLGCAATAVTSSAARTDEDFRMLPNPARQGTRLLFSLSTAGPVRLAIHDAAGRRIAALLDRWLAAGPHEIFWDGADRNGIPVAPGTYFASLESRAGQITRKLVRVD